MDLAVVIPAYKDTFLAGALNSLAAQTNKNFKVYIGDDCSPYNIYSVCKTYEQVLDISYHRFPSNLGKVSLVKQWERCVALIGDEKWLWVFSDDDVAEENCVEQFYQALKITKSYYDVYRFNTCVINEHGIFKSEAPASPTVEDAMSLTINILLGKRGNSMPDHIFKKTKYIELNGFVDFTYGQSSDWATSIAYAYDKGLYTITGPRVKWRYSGQNISSRASQHDKGLMITGYMQFLTWIGQKFDTASAQKFGRDRNEVLVAAKRNFVVLMKTHYRGIPLGEVLNVARAYASVFKAGYFRSFLHILNLNLKVAVQKLKGR